MVQIFLLVYKLSFFLFKFKLLDNGVAVNNLRSLLNEFNDFDYFELNERSGYISQACNGLSYLHSKEILCIDLKPSNMLANGKKDFITVKISDFGEVSFFQSTVTSTLTTNSLKGLYNLC